MGRHSYKPGERVRLTIGRHTTGTYMCVDARYPEEKDLYHFIIIDGVKWNGESGYSLLDMEVWKL